MKQNLFLRWIWEKQKYIYFDSELEEVDVDSDLDQMAKYMSYWRNIFILLNKNSKIQYSWEKLIERQLYFIQEKSWYLINEFEKFDTIPYNRFEILLKDWNNLVI
jgi:hypothetical protein